MKGHHHLLFVKVLDVFSHNFITHVMVNVIVFQDQKMQTWDLVCGKLLDTKLLIWESLFQQLFLNRTKVSVNSYCLC